MRLLIIAVTLFFATAVPGFFCPDCLRAEHQRLQPEKSNEKGNSKIFRKTPEQLPEWVVKVGTLYMQQNNQGSMEPLLTLLEKNLGINTDGNLNIIQAWDSKYILAVSGDNVLQNEEWQYHLKNYLSLTGLNHLYFKICTTYQEQYADRFLRYFENGFYPHKALFSRNAHYYQSLYYYLSLIANNINHKLTQTISFCSKNPESDPPFLTGEDMNRLSLGVSVAAELDTFLAQKTDTESFGYENFFSDQERTWIKNTTKYFLDTQTHSVLLSYDWFRKNMPLTASAEAVSHNILQEWEEQVVTHRTRLPLMFFAQQGETRINIENLFESTLEKLRLDNRKVDIMVLTALQTWLSKQVRHGIKIDDRIQYNNILAELKACPSGWIFVNLYDCRKFLAQLKELAKGWPDKKNPEKIFESRVIDIFFNAQEKINSIFSDFEKILGENQQIGPANSIFHQYRGEIHYYFKYIQFESFQQNNMVTPGEGPEANYLKDFKTVFIAAPHNQQSHMNLLKGYNLLFRKLLADGRIDEIQNREREMEIFINGKYSLGECLSHDENNLYDIYRTLTYAYLSYDNFEANALKAAQKGFLLAKKYYLQAARQAGYIASGKIGAITWDNTEMDDYQRQFELYKNVANKLGKKIRLLVGEEDVRLYNKMQDIRKMERYIQ